MQADYNHNDFSQTAEADKNLLVRFYYKERPDRTKTEELGRPVFKEVAYLEIRAAGHRDIQVCRPASDADKQRFGAHYKAFIDRVEAPVEGMPLSEWPQVTRSQADQLSFLNIKTVEQMASVTDTNISNFAGGYTLRDKAKKWLETADVASILKEKEDLQATIEELQVQVAELMTSMEPVKLTETRVNVLLPETDLDGSEAVAVPAAPATKPRRRKT